MTETPKRNLPTYDDICLYAEAIRSNTTTEDAIVGGRRFSTDGNVMWDTRKGGRCYEIDRCINDPRMVEAVKRTAALRVK
jgi:hypothetical protein